MLLGLAVGDALGNTSEGQDPGARRREHGEITHYRPNRRAGGRAVGLPSDDSQLAFWTLEQLNADGGLVPERLARRLSSQRIFGIGQSVRAFVRNFKDEKAGWAEAGVPSAGNGALMRIAPALVPHLAHPSPDLWADAALAAMITHNDRASTATCVAFVSLLWSALQRTEPPAPGFWLDRFLEVASPLEGDTQLEPRFGRHVGRYRGPLTRFVETVVGPALKSGRSVVEAGNEWGSGAYLLETVPTVLYILERHARTPREAILRAVNDTVDNDTIAAIVGAAVGALHGPSALEAEWLHGLTGRTSETDDGRVFELIEEARECWEPKAAG
jgi:ADP-ribosylglycohydrolase